MTGELTLVQTDVNVPEPVCVKFLHVKKIKGSPIDFLLGNFNIAPATNKKSRKTPNLSNLMQILLFHF